MDRLPVEGETFGRYRLLQQLGEGGMGVVYVAQDEVLNRKVALKLVLPRHAADPEFRSRFAREAEAQARLESSHVVRIYDYGDQDGVLFLCTQYVDGGDLAMRVADSGALAPALAVEVVSQVLAGLEEAHQAGVVHRDVKPANVLLRPRRDDVQAYLCDFGIATMAGQGLTQAGQVIGSLPWMAPERHYGTEPGPVGDVYSAGCVLWYALTGAAPYTGSDGEVMMGHIEGALPQLPGRTPFIKRMNIVLAKALAKHPEDRYATAGAMAADLRGLGAIAPGDVRLADATVVRAAITKPSTGPRAASTSVPSGRSRWLPPLVAAAAVLALVAGGMGVRAALTGDLELADGTTQVGETPYSVAPQPTLSPIRRAGGGPAAVAPPAGVSLGEGPGPASDLGVGDPDLGIVGTDRDRTTSSQTPTSGTRVQPSAAAPTYRYRCWDDRLTTSTCSYPIGRAGATWMVRYSADWSCTASKPTVGSTNGIYDSFRCGYSGGTGANAIYLMRMSSETQARNWINSVITTVGGRNTWSDGTQTAGWSVSGTGANGGATQHRWGRYWTSSENTWLIFINASTASARNDGISRTGGAAALRPLRQVKGISCSETSC